MAEQDSRETPAGGFSEKLSDRLLDFAVRIGKVVDAMPETRLGRHVAGQLVRCGTSPVPNYEEARGAESRNDFAHKLQICLKELRETRGWIRLVVRAQLLPGNRMEGVEQEANELCNLFGKSVVTTKTSPAQDYAGKTDPEFCRAIGQRVRATREAAGMTQVQLCECIPGMTQSNLLKIESGKIEPRVASLQRIAAACGADYKALLP